MASVLPESMCAIEIKAPGGPEALVPALRPLRPTLVLLPALVQPLHALSSVWSIQNS